MSQLVLRSSCPFVLSLSKGYMVPELCFNGVPYEMGGGSGKEMKIWVIVVNTATCIATALMAWKCFSACDRVSGVHLDMGPPISPKTLIYPC